MPKRKPRPAPAAPMDRIGGRVVDAKTNSPLGGLIVRAQHGAGKDLGTDITTADGRFVIHLSKPVPPARPKAGAKGKGRRPRALRLRILDATGRLVRQAAVPPRHAPGEPMRVPVRLAPPRAPEGPTVVELAAKLKLKLPRKARQALTRARVRSLPDLRRKGGLGAVPGMPLRPGHPVMRTLDAHAHFATVLHDEKERTAVVKKGFGTLQDVVGTPRSRFVSALRGTLGDFRSAAIHTATTAGALTLNGVLAGTLAEVANGGFISIRDPKIVDQFPPRCHCEDCEAAVSPLAYLADLIQYALGHVEVNQLPVTLQLLSERFHQPFGQLPADCAAVDRRVRQARICVEVLRGHIRAQGPFLFPGVVAAGRDHVRRAYLDVLAQLGTSYEEIRLARTADAEARRALADRLGIDLQAARPDRLDTLLHDPGAVGLAGTLSEPTLETLFGLADTTRDPLSAGAKAGDPQDQIVRWSLQGVEWGRNTDGDGVIYGRLNRLFANTYRVRLYRNAARTQLIAVGERASALGDVELAPRNGSGLSGRVVINYVADLAGCELQAVPNLTSWRLGHLRGLWRGQDGPANPYLDAEVPLVDPDVLGPDDFRHPRAKAAAGDPDRAFDLWIRRRQWVDGQLQALVLQALRLRAELNLYKIRTCRNIAGIKREVEPYAAATDTSTGLPVIGADSALSLPGAVTIRPTPYRYRALIERAKSLVQLAAQIESSMLSALEKRDQEYYNLLKARQDIRLTRAGVRLQDLRVKEAEGGVKLAELQEERAEFQADHYQSLLSEGLSALEQSAIGLMETSADLQIAAAVLNFAAAAVSLTGAAVAWDTSSFSLAASGLSSTGGGLSSIAGALSTRASIQSTYASYERRAQEWEFQMNLARQDVRIGAQQVHLAQDHVRVVGQERNIAEIQADHAERTVDFLNNKFANAELYDWMSDVLERVYSFFLQHATAVAQLAANQLAFERQEIPPPVIQADYWEAPTGLDPGEGPAPERRGLTGSARLLQDVHQLDQYAFETDQRKLQLTKTISLARAAPAEFERFRETGVMTFETPMRMFDRDFPGHYLRLIRRVRTSVIALVPPTEQIQAVLSSAGVSRVVIGGDTFQTVVVRRDPESVALTSPRDATGLFEMQPESEMPNPFEWTGVATTWELRLPKAANRFDYRTLADVLVTIEYTARNSFQHGQQVVRDLGDTFFAYRPFSFRHELADQWYDLHNPEQSATPMTVQFTTRRDDFPPNLENLRIQDVLLQFSVSGGLTMRLPAHLLFAEEGGGFAGGAAVPIDDLISARRAGSWAVFIGKSPLGRWQLALPPELIGPFRNEQIRDLLFVISYSGRTPAWPGLK